MKKFVLIIFSLLIISSCFAELPNWIPSDAEIYNDAEMTIEWDSDVQPQSNEIVNYLVYLYDITKGEPDQNIIDNCIYVGETQSKEYTFLGENYPRGKYIIYLVVVIDTGDEQLLSNPVNSIMIDAVYEGKTFLVSLGVWEIPPIFNLKKK